MKIISPGEVTFEFWKRLFYCSLLLLIVAVAATARLSHLEARLYPSHAPLAEMAIWRFALILSFQSAPLVWADFIYTGYRQKLISIPLRHSMSLLRMPLAVWAAGCLTTGIFLWPALSL